MAFHEVRLSIKIAYGSITNTEYLTQVITPPSGYENRNAAWEYGRRSWNITKEKLDRNEAFILESFYRARKARNFGFRLRDWGSYRITNEPLPLKDGFHAQLQFIYPDEINPETQFIYKPVLEVNVVNDVTSDEYSPDITLIRNGVAMLTGWSVNRTNGLITFDADQTGNTFTWSGSWDYPVRFLADKASIRRQGADIHDWSNFEVIELKLRG